MSDQKLDWALPVMRAGYAGRGMTYLAIAGLSLWAIWQGGEAKGTTEALQAVENQPFGQILLYVIGVGLICYMGWRLLDAVLDLEDYGTDAEGLIARGGMIVTGLIHGALGVAAIALTTGGGGGGEDGSAIVTATREVMQMPGGRWIVGLAGLATIGAGIYYIHKAWTKSYREKLRGNHFTTHWSWALQAGVAAQGVVVGLVGMFLAIAALRRDPDEAGGLGQSFSWLAGQAYGQVLVTLLCLGLLGFAFFLFVNARYRIVPRLSDPDVTTLKAALA